MNVDVNWRRASCLGGLLLAVASQTSSVAGAVHNPSATLPAHETSRPRETPLLPRELLFGAAERSAPQLSPDGSRLSFLAPASDGVTNIWLAKGLDTAGAQLLTHDTHRAILGYHWALDGVHILYWQDKDGDENWHLFAVDTGSGETKDLTPDPGVRMQNLLMNPKHPHEILVGLNRRSRLVFDMYRINLDTGSSVLDTSNPSDVLSWSADSDFVIRAATAFVPQSGTTVLRVRDRKDAPWRDLASWRFEEAVFTGQVNGGNIVASFAPDGRSLYAISTTGSDHSRLVKIDLASGAERPVAATHTTVRPAADATLRASGDCDVAEDDGYSGTPGDLGSFVLQNPAGGEPDAVAVECMDRRWEVLNPAVRTDLQVLQKQIEGFPYIVSRDRADARWVVATLVGNRPPEYSLYERKSRTLTPLFSEQPQLAKETLPRPTAYEITARDGLKIPIYLTRPIGAGRSPLMLYPHGGPWFRDHDEFDPVVQLLVNRGYAVLQVEYRGSTGFGKAFLNAGNHEFGLKMRDDLLDGIEWAVRQGFADPQRVGVLGFSAGGYLSLRVTEARPALFRATVDVVGPTDVADSLTSFPPNWEAVKTRWVRRIGDAQHDPDLNRRLSPRFEKETIRGSLLVAQGANDVRVKRELSDAFVAMLRKRGSEVTYIVYMDEGHSFVRPENNLDFFGRVEDFLAPRLGGRAQPWHPQPGAKAEVK